MAKRLGGHWVISRAITAADAGATVTLLDVPARTLVAQVVLIVTEAFAGGEPAIDVGEPGDADAWVGASDVRYYATASQITATPSAGLTDGTAYVAALMLPLAEVV